jgi:hypothetical protein
MSKKKRGQYRIKGGYVSFPLAVLKSDAYLSLTSKSRALLVYIQSLEFPERNGRIGLSEANASKHLDCSPNTASKAFDELINRGLIVCYNEGCHLSGMAREWCITYLPVNGREPTDDWKEYRPKTESLPQ